MKRFSERIGAVDVSAVVQMESMPNALLNSIWNFIFTLFDHRGWPPLSRLSSQHFFKVPVDDLPFGDDRQREWVKERLFSMDWYEVYDYVEFVCRAYKFCFSVPKFSREQLHHTFNTIFEEERSGYRFVGGVLVPISGSSEVSAIEDALSLTSQTGVMGANGHISAALRLLASKPAPDFRNSIKESISAVEAIAKTLGATDGSGLAGPLKELSKQISMHPALQKGFLSLYGYTSDENGIRHAMLNEPNIGYDEAKYMVIACSAFVHYLAAKAEAAGILNRS